MSESSSRAAPLGPIRVGIALGSNLGDRPAELLAARSFLEILTVSGWREAPWYESEPVDCPPGSAAFLNTLVEIEVDRESSPRDLLARLKAYEIDRGRAASHALNSPRPIDFDIIYFGDLILNTPDLVIPHPRAPQRRFVLEPLADIDPDLVLPGQTRTVADLLRGVGDQQVVRKWGPAAP